MNFFRLNPSNYEFNGDEKTIIAVKKKDEGYEVTFHMDNSRKIKATYTTEEVLDEILSRAWILT